MPQKQDTPTFFRKLGQLLRQRSEHKIIVGDFNLVLDVEMDRENTYYNNNRSRDELLEIADEFCMVDI